MDTSNVEEAQPSSWASKRGGWITFPFISVATAGSGIGIWGLLANLIVYLIEKFHVKNIDAAQITNVVSGCASLSPLIGAILADSFGFFPVISISYCISFLGSVLLTLTATLDSLSARPCENASNLCKTQSRLQFAVLYAGLTFATIGIGGTRYNLATIGATQLNKTNEQTIFFNWFFLILYASAVIGSTAVVYIEDNISWAWGFGICAAANSIGLAIFLLGNQFYRRRQQAKQSPFLRLAFVLVAAVRKRKILLSTKAEDYHHENDRTRKVPQTLPKSNFRFDVS